MADPAKRLKSGLENTVSELLSLDDPAPISQKPPAPVNSVVIQPDPTPKPSVRPVQGNGRRVPYRGPIAAKGSQIAPVRESSADYIDGRAERATGRNSRLNLSLTEHHLNAFKWGCKVTRRSYNEIFESWVEEHFAQQYNDILAAAKEEEEARLERMAANRNGT